MSERSRQSSQQALLLFWYANWMRQIYNFFCGQSKTPAEKWGNKEASASGNGLCQEQQARKDASPYAAWAISCNTLVSSHYLAAALWIFTGSHQSSPLAPHTIPTAMRLSTAPWVTLQSRNGNTGLSWEADKVMRPGPVAITITSCSPVLSRQSQSNKEGLRSS